MTLKAIDGKPVVDAKRAITIHITKADINKADVKRPETCAAARAICREHHAIEARVHLGRVYVRSNESNWIRYMTPRSMRAEIIAFDRGGTFAPGEFTLSAPQPTKRATGKAQGSLKSKNGPRHSKKKRRPPHIVTDVRTGPA